MVLPLSTASPPKACKVPALDVAAAGAAATAPSFPSDASCALSDVASAGPALIGVLMDACVAEYWLRAVAPSSASAVALPPSTTADSDALSGAPATTSLPLVADVVVVVSEGFGWRVPDALPSTPLLPPPEFSAFASACARGDCLLAAAGDEV